MEVTAREGLRLLVIGDESDSSLVTCLPGACDVAFASPAAMLGASTGERNPDTEVVLFDTRSIPSDRSRLVRAIVQDIRDRAPTAKIVALVGSKDRRTAAVASDSGAWDVATPQDRCGLATRLRVAAACRDLEAGPSDSAVAGSTFQMVGTSPAMRSLFTLIRQVGTTDVPVLITGESGTGKELAALAIHERSLRSQGPFIPINCAAIPEALLESELFGHERGAFTGAFRKVRGMVEAAHGGTLFLDEVGELAARLQSKLLRFLQDHIVQPVGGRGDRFTVDVRIIAATNRDLTGAVDRGEFRPDLYYRLAVFPLHVPPLRDRAEDVLLMARVFLQRYAKEAQRDLRGFAPDANDALWKNSWPGNVRELINRVRRAVVVAPGPLVSAADLGLDIGPVEAPLLPLRESLARAELDCIRLALERAEGNRCQAARLLGISRSTLYELLRRHRLE